MTLTTDSNARRLRLAAGFIVAVHLAACGGGGSGGTDSGTGSTDGQALFASGVVHGLGTIAVNGASFDDSAATVTGDDGQPLDSGALQLGMVVDVQATSATGTAPAPASAIRVRSEIEGPVAAIDAAAGSLTVLGQRVSVNEATVFDSELGGGLAQLRANDIVEVYGFRGADGIVVATRIEREDRDEDDYKLRGVISGLDTAARRLRIGGLEISYAGATTLPAILADGQQVRVELHPTPDAGGIWQASEITSVAAAPAAATAIKAELEGLITTFASAASFEVNGVPVDASAVTTLPAGLALGQRVEVEGAFVDGVLRARHVEIEDERGDDDEGLEIDGSIDSIDTAARTFVVRGVTVAYGAARFEDGSAASLAVGVRVDVQGRLGSDGSTIEATEIEFDD